MQETENRSSDNSDELREFPPGRPEPMDALKVVEAFGAAWADHDLDAALAMVADDCIFDATGPAPDGTRCVGVEAIRAMWAPIFGDSSVAIR